MSVANLPRKDKDLIHVGPGSYEENHVDPKKNPVFS